MSEEMQIRPMAAADIDLVMAIAAGLDTAPHWPRSAYESALDPSGAPPRVALVAAELAGQVIGFVVASLIPPQAELETIAVSPSQQRRGAGSSLLAALFRELESRRIGEVILEVRASNAAARQFYRAHCFRAFAERRGYYQAPQRRGPSVPPQEADAASWGAQVAGDPAHPDTGEPAILMRAPITNSSKRK